MKANVKFYKCLECGNVAGLMKDKGGDLACCEKAMELLTPGNADTKYAPRVVRDGEFLILSAEPGAEWLSAVGTRGTVRVTLAEYDEPKVKVYCPDCTEGETDVYAYYNERGLFRTII
ncbi:hypothetical protein FACS189490_01930 [Clostridia bacterium]|nr:hypothetical protein FACS189490_01930 [Clostridia bacterium]